jgi:hypothetical protein
MRLEVEGPVQSNHCEREGLAGTAERDESIPKTTGVKSNYYRVDTRNAPSDGTFGAMRTTACAVAMAALPPISGFARRS